MKEPQRPESDLNLDEFRQQLEQLHRLGMTDWLRQLPGMRDAVPETAQHWLESVGRMIDAMTPEERREPYRIDVNRRLLIALHSNCQPHEVQQLLLQFEEVRGLMRQAAGLNVWDRFKLIIRYQGPKLPPDEVDP